MSAVTAKPNTINWLATILAKAQGVLNTETGGTVDVGLECANIRREHDRLIGIAEAACTENKRLWEELASRERARKIIAALEEKP